MQPALWTPQRRIWLPGSSVPVPQVLLPFGSLVPCCRGKGPLQTAVPAGTLQVDLAAFWELEESSGTRQDAHTNNLDLTDNNTVTSEAGKVGTAAHFTAANTEYLEVADATPLSFADEAFYVCGWVKRDTAGNRGIIAKNGGTTNEWSVYIPIATGFFRGVVSNGGTNGIVNSSVSLGTAVWNFLEFWHDPVANVIGLCVNRGTDQTVAHTVGCQDLGNPLRFGRDQWEGNVYHDGGLDQFGVWRRIPATAERDYLYNSGAGRTYAEILTASP